MKCYPWILMLILLWLLLPLEGCMEINNPQTFDHIKEVNGEILKPKITSYAEFEKGKADLQPLSWYNTLMSKLYLPPALIGGTGKVLQLYIVDIGNWDMDAVVTWHTPHGMADYSKIIPLTPMIRNDPGGAESIYPLTRGNTAQDTSPQGYINSVDATNIDLVKLVDGLFDSTGFDEPDYNRGWMPFLYWD